MELSKMYRGIEFSPTVMLTANISATDTVIPVSDVSAFPDAPNIATIGTDIGAETIIYANISEGALTGCTRGIEGTAKEWSADEIISRNFTAKDHNDIIKNIEELYKNKLDAEYKVEVVNSSDISKTGKALDATQNNPSVEGTLAKKIAENTKQINNCFKKVDASKYDSAFEFAMNCPNAVARYAGYNYPDMPFNGTWWGDIWTISGVSTAIYAKPNNSDTIYYRIINDGKYIDEWQQIATITQLQALIDANNA